MSTGVNEPQTTTPAVDALTGFRASLDQLIAAVEGGGLDHLDDLGLVGFLQGFEVQRNRLALVDHRMLRDAEQRGLAERLGQARLTTVLVGALRISAGEAARRVRASAAVGDRVSMCGEPLPPVRPVLAAAQRTGQVSVEQVSIIERGLGGCQIVCVSHPEGECAHDESQGSAAGEPGDGRVGVGESVW